MPTLSFTLVEYCEVTVCNKCNLAFARTGYTCSQLVCQCPEERRKVHDPRRAQVVAAVKYLKSMGVTV